MFCNKCTVQLYKPPLGCVDILEKDKQLNLHWINIIDILLEINLFSLRNRLQLSPEASFDREITRRSIY